MADAVVNLEFAARIALVDESPRFADLLQTMRQERLAAETWIYTYDDEQVQSNGTVEHPRKSEIIFGPHVMLGTKRPSMTSR